MKYERKLKMKDITNEESIVNFGNLIINLGKHIIKHPEKIDNVLIEYQPIGETLYNSPIGYENACKIVITLVKEAG